MAVLNKILAWSEKGLVPWQRDAVRRLFEKEALSKDDYDDLYAMMKSAHGIKDEKERTPVPLSKDNLPAGNEAEEAVILKSLHDLENVNKIADKQNLEFSQTGMTIIYGGNGAGKSGYARVLKKACRARDSQEKVHTNAFDAKAGKATPQAIFDIEENGMTKSINWIRDKLAPSELSTIAVFDTKCARAYLDNEQEAAYLPYGLDIVESLSQNVLPEMSSRLSADLLTVNANKEQFNDLIDETAVGQLIGKLSHKSDAKKFTELAKLNEDELKRLDVLDKTLREADPKEKAKSIKLSSQRITQLVGKIDTAHSWVKDDAINKIKSIDDEAESAIKAEVLAAAEFRAGEDLLEGTGDSLWKTLFESAKKYSTEVAYSDKEYPFVDEGSKCVLCQRELDDESKDRLKRFEKYITEDVSKLAKEKTQVRENAKKRIKEAVLSFNMDDALKEELSEIDKDIVNNIAKYEAGIEQIRTWVLESLESHDWSDQPGLGDDPRVEVKVFIENLNKQAEELDKAADDKKKIALENEQSELRARANLSPRLKSLVEMIEGLKLQNMLNSCKNDLKTKPISDKAKELASEAVTQALKDALDEEFEALGISYIKTKLKDRINKGKVLHKLILDLPVSINLNEVLSEGEQRAIALGSFLAEMRLGGHKGGIVFDDPVSSLDHCHRRYVAQRLVDEANERQVIIFTHDTVFLSELTFLLNQRVVPHLVQHLEWLGDTPGTVQAGLPWEHKSFPDRVDKHQKAQKALLKQWSHHPNDELSGLMRREYGRLRATLERVIQDRIFNGTVQRYTDWIRVNHLEKVVGFTKVEHDEIARLHKRCCDVTDSHDPASAKNAPVPTPQELDKDINDLVAVVEVIKTRQKAI